MTEGFSNPIIGGGGALVYPAIQSPNFVDSVSGWQISKDGSAEFNNLEIRGSFLGADYILNSSGLFFYNGAPANGNLIASIASAAGTDTFGNSYSPGFVSYSTAFAQIITGNLILGITGAGGSTATVFVPDTTQNGSLALDSGHPAGQHSITLKLLSTTGTGRALQAVISEDNANPVTSAMLEVQGDTAITGTGGGLLTVTETGGAPASQPVQFLAKTAGDRVLGIEVSGDADMRLTIDSNGKIGLGSGTAFTDTFLQRGAANQLNVTGADLDIDTAGRGLKIKEGSNARMGSGSLSGGQLVVANTSVTASTRIFVFARSTGANSGFLGISSITPGTGFTIKSSNASDGNGVNWLLIEPG